MRGQRRKLRSCDWTPEMDKKLLAAGLCPHTERYKWGSGRLRLVAEELGKTEKAAISRMKRLMQKHKHRPGLWTEEGLWSAAEDDVIRAAIRLGMPRWDLVAELLGRTRGACNTRACNLRKRVEASPIRKIRERLRRFL